MASGRGGGCPMLCGVPGPGIIMLLPICWPYIAIMRSLCWCCAAAAACMRSWCMKALSMCGGGAGPGAPGRRATRSRVAQEPQRTTMGSPTITWVIGTPTSSSDLHA